ncbi:unnamed protein product [Menidia menidia]|uniref:(Atlantic silverside) hypothetical protein n=1 Tax=Menidia menidia TaxID=238744 RepID=A0A8S4BKW6_9TELE|nr:unnamed protein product [Menidia menidia]
MEEAARLVLYLEAAPRSLRCFLWQRDSCPGSAIPAEFCQAVEDSHLRAFLITPSFVQDGWCNYMMHQALAEGPMSNRTIPMLRDLLHSQYPQELKFYYYIDLSKNKNGYSMVSKTVFLYLENLVKKEMELLGNSGSSNGCLKGGSSQEGKQSHCDPAGTPSPQEETRTTDQRSGGICCDHN